MRRASISLFPGAVAAAAASTALSTAPVHAQPLPMVLDIEITEADGWSASGTFTNTTNTQMDRCGVLVISEPTALEFERMILSGWSWEDDHPDTFRFLLEADSRSGRYAQDVLGPAAPGETIEWSVSLYVGEDFDAAAVVDCDSTSVGIAYEVQPPIDEEPAEEESPAAGSLSFGSLGS